MSAHTMIDVTTEQLKRYLAVSIEMKENILITGAPGVGKSQLFDSVTKDIGYDSMVLHPAISDPVDFKGIPFVSEGKGGYLLDDHLSLMLNTQQPLAVLIDDLGQAPGAVQAACMQLLEARAINGHKVSDQVSFVAATNRRRDASGVGGLFEALKTRFRPILNFEPDVNSWTDWAIDNLLPAELIQFIRFRPALLNNPVPSKEIVNSACPRTIAAVGRYMNRGLVEAPIIAGCCGDAWAAEFLAFLKVWRKLPNIQKVMLDPHNTQVPQMSEPSVLYALAGAISKHMSHDNASPLMVYVSRLPVEFGAMIVKDSTRRDPSLHETEGINSWCTKNFNLM